MIHIVTTFSRKQWDDYVHVLLPKSTELWPHDIQWQIWLDKPDDLAISEVPIHGTIELHYLSSDPEHEAFMAAWKARVAGDPVLRECLKKFRYPYSYVKDAGTFAHKVFAMTSEAARDRAEWLIFLDADIETHQPVTMDWLRAILGDADLVHLGRGEVRSSDTAFLAIRPCRSSTGVAYGDRDGEVLLDMLRVVYTSGDIFNYGEWIDGHIVARLCAVFEGMGAKVKNLSAGIDGLDVFEKTVLGERLRHWKGPRGKAMLLEHLKA